jgi:SNF2 family DNA or RNA helicase
MASLVVCPATLVLHWQEEILKFCGEQFTTLAYVGKVRDLEVDLYYLLLYWIEVVSFCIL